MPIPSTPGCPDPTGHTAHIAAKAYDDLDRLADRVAFLAAHDLGYAREVADDLADGLRTLVNRLEAEPPRLFGYDPCDDPDLSDGYYEREARRTQHHSSAFNSGAEHERDRGATSPPDDARDEPIRFALTDAAARLLDDHHTTRHVTSRIDDPRVHVHQISGRSGRGRPIR